MMKNNFVDLDQRPCCPWCRSRSPKRWRPRCPPHKAWCRRLGYFDVVWQKPKYFFLLFYRYNVANDQGPPQLASSHASSMDLEVSLTQDLAVRPYRHFLAALAALCLHIWDWMTRHNAIQGDRPLQTGSNAARPTKMSKVKHYFRGFKATQLHESFWVWKSFHNKGLEP